MARRLVLLTLVAVVAAGCGVRNSTPFTPSATASCLRSHGFTEVTMDPARIGFVAAFADQGGIRAASPTHNVLTIAFAGDNQRASTASLEQAFRAHAPKRLRAHMSDIMSVSRNAVLVWTISPLSNELATANGCLRS